MTIFMRLMRYFSSWECAFAEYRTQRLTESFTHGLIDLDTFIEVKNSISCERRKSMADHDRWDAALNALTMKGTT